MVPVATAIDTAKDGEGPTPGSTVGATEITPRVRTLPGGPSRAISWRCASRSTARRAAWRWTRGVRSSILREGEGLTGTKVGCRHGQCGACTVHLDGRPRLACLTLAAQLEGREVTTIEGLARVAEAQGTATVDGVHPLQVAFVEHDGFQCGYCTPGQIMSGADVISEGHAGSAAEVREYMSGNLYRCGAYPGITATVMDAAARIGAPQEGGGARADYHLGLIESARAQAPAATPAEEG